MRWLILYGILTSILTFSREMRLLFLNESFVATSRRLPWIGTRVDWCPEPLEQRSNGSITVRDAVRSGPPRIVFAGYHSERKGTDWALGVLSAWPKPLHVVVAGPSEKPELTKAMIAKLPPHITATYDLRQLTGEELADYIHAAEVVALPYRRFGGSSSIFIHALQNGTPVLVTDYGMMDRQVQMLGCGSIFPERGCTKLPASFGRAP